MVRDHPRAAKPILVVLLLLLLVSATGAAARTVLFSSQGASGRNGAAFYAGWAMEAYPGDSVGLLKAEMQRQVRHGANVVWLGHNNPGEVGYSKREPGLSYAVWAAYRNAADPAHRGAVAMVEAQRRALEAARAAGVRVVLPVGYQIQMGTSWNAAHVRDVRRSADGSLYDASGGPNHSASFYAPSYRHDIQAYYRWIDSTFVRHFSGTIAMLNLADEPEDGDYSFWADRAFRAEHGYGLHDASSSPVRQVAVGRFESDYIANYAAWSARQWLKLAPKLPVTMSFCGGYSRYMHEGPNLEHIFQETPRNFVVTFDAYPRDGLYDTPLREQDLIALFTLVRTLGHYSAVYHRRLWLWSAANSWGLNEASADPGRIADAVANGIYLVQLARQTGGNLQGVAVWNYNIRGQGLYADSHRTTYDPDRMFARVSASFPMLRALMASPAGRPNIAILAPDAPVLRAAGAQLAMRAADPYRWQDLAALARANASAVVVTHLDRRALTAVRTALVLARQPGDLSPTDVVALRGIIQGGGTVVAGDPIARDLAAGAGTTSETQTIGGPFTVARLATGHGVLLAVQGGPVEGLFSDSQAGWARGIWREVLHRVVPGSGYVVSTGGTTLLYSISPGGFQANMAAPTQAHLQIYNPDGVLVSRRRVARQSGSMQIYVERRSYVVLVGDTVTAQMH